MLSKRKSYILILIIVFFLVSCWGIIHSYIEARYIAEKKIIFSHTDIPTAFDGKKIIFISDIHCNNFFTGNEVLALVNRINEKQPDIVLLGGDFTSKKNIYFDQFFQEIKKLRANYGIYYVLGNHDHWEDPKMIKEGFAKIGFYNCDNQSYWIKEAHDSIKIGGVGDLWEDTQIIKKTVNDITHENFCILISHNPDYIEELESDKVDLMLSGHTHAGQVTLFGLWAPIMPSFMHREHVQTGQKYRYGMIRHPKTELYVTSGIGMGEFPFRFFAQPELVEITLKKQ